MSRFRRIPGELRRLGSRARRAVQDVNLLGEWSRTLIALAAFFLYTGVHRALVGETPTLNPAAFNVMAAVYLALTWLLIVRATPQSTRRWAEVVRARSKTWQRFLGSEVSFTSIISVSLLGLIAAIGLLPGANPEVPGLLALYALGVVMAWLVLHISYALLYAYIYYGGEEGGLEFPGGDAPDKLDFTYFAFTVGTTFAVSDVSVVRRAFRRAVLGHTVLSFAYNTVIIALVINLVVR